MATLISILLFAGFFSFYNLSKKTAISRNSFLEKMHQKPRLSKAIGFLCFAITLWLCIDSYGIATGVSSWCIALMTIGSLIVLLGPLKFFNYKAALILVLLCVATEFLMC